jgi:curved DNA-binding protein
VLKIVIPATMTDETNQLWQQLADKAAFDPREEWSK